jgi:septal ring factor EnvC (AmiA/AmiB activator)
MKIKIAMLVFAVVALALAVVLFVTRQRAAEQRTLDMETILYHSNQWVTTQEKLDKEVQVTALLHRDLDTLKSEYGDMSNVVNQTLDKLTATEVALSTTKDSLKAAQETVRQREADIAALKNQNSELDQQARDLTVAITNLTTQIEDTRRRLTASEGDKAFLEKELKRLLAEKADLERQFNDLVVLKAQVARLKEELNISRRIEWIRRGLFAPGEQKGAALLMQPHSAPAKRPPTPTHDLNVEVTSDGSVRIVPPATNTPTTTNPPAR